MYKKTSGSKPHKVMDKQGKVIGSHATKAGALRQLAAIEINKKKGK